MATGNATRDDRIELRTTKEEKRINQKNSGKPYFYSYVC